MCTLLKKVYEVNNKIDTGVEVTAITEKVWRRMGAPPITSSDCTLIGTASYELTMVGKYEAEMSAGQNMIAIDDVYVLKGLHRCLLGQPAIEKLELLAVKTIAQIEPQPRAPRRPPPSFLNAWAK